MKKLVLPVSLLAAVAVSMGYAAATKADSGRIQNVNAEDPINKKCPITGKDIVAGRTSEYKKQLIGFCCGDCVSKFEGDPEKYIKKVKEFKKASAEEISLEDPINKKCPITGKDIVAGRTSEYKKQLIGFCCGDCVSKFEGDPEKYIKKVKEFKKSSAQ